MEICKSWQVGEPPHGGGVTGSTRGWGTSYHIWWGVQRVECRVQGNLTLTCFLKQVPNFSGLASNRFRAFRGKNHPQPVPVSVSRRKRDLTSCALRIALNHDDVTCIPTTPWKAPSCFKTSCAPLELFFHSALIIQ